MRHHLDPGARSHAHDKVGRSKALGSMCNSFDVNLRVITPWQDSEKRI